MTRSEIRRRIDDLMRRFVRELALIKLRRTVEPIAQQWNPAEPPAGSLRSPQPVWR